MPSRDNWKVPFSGLSEPGLVTDLYELTMAQTYFQHGMSSRATFSLFIRSYPPNRGYFVAAGLEDVLRYLEEWRFPEESIDYLVSTRMFHGDFLEYLSGVRFTGDVWAMPEGRVFFSDEPVLEVSGPVVEAQAVESYVINQVNLQTMMATKASRCVRAGQGRPIVDFSLRRTQGVDAAMKVARCSYIAGFQATSNVMAGKAYGMPLAGTMAHSFVSSYEHEVDAFRAYAESFPDRAILLIDTYDTVAGARNAALVGNEMKARGRALDGVRLDSGDLESLSREVRAVLDDAELPDVRIVASGGLDELDVDNLVGRGAPIDAFGVGTKMGVSADAPWTDMAYKLVQYGCRPVLKLSTGKVSVPGEKQVFRLRDAAGSLAGDVIALRDEDEPSAGAEGLPPEPLLRKVMQGGRTMEEAPGLDEARELLCRDLEALDDGVMALRDPAVYPVHLSPRLDRLRVDMEVSLAAESADRVAAGGTPGPVCEARPCE
ncbi:MAG: nicotinate phosphoribosyltransferase [Dehalococcoidia bacterium]|nr:nicotinate phosphoribosyltransferase [Dehalococcoidia bacterium]